MKISVYKHSIFVVFMLILMLAMSVTTGMAQSSSQEPIKLKVLLLPYLSFAPLFIAEAEGYFVEQGLDIEFFKVAQSTDVIPALIKGEVDVMAGVVSVSILNAMARGGTLQIVADKSHIPLITECPHNALLTRRELVETGELNNPDQLRGRKLGLIPISIDGYYVEKILKTANLTLDDVSADYILPPLQAEAIQKGTIDIAAVGEPWITRILQEEHVVLWLKANDIIPDFQYSAIYYGVNLLEKNPEAGQRFMAAYLKAVRQYNQGKTTRNLDILVKHTGLERELLQNACWPPIHGDGHINVESVLEFQTWAVEKGWLDTVVPANQFWNPRYVEYAIQVLGASE